MLKKNREGIDLMNMYEWMMINDEICDEFYAQILLGKFETVGSLSSKNNNGPWILGLKLL